MMRSDWIRDGETSPKHKKDNDLVEYRNIFCRELESEKRLVIWVHVSTFNIETRVEKVTVSVQP